MLIRQPQISTADFLSFYQQGASLNKYSPISLQNGGGLRSIFRSIFRMLKPVLLNQGKRAMSKIADFSRDISNGENVKESAFKHLKAFKDDIVKQSGGKRSRKKKQRSKEDIFNNVFKRKKCS